MQEGKNLSKQRTDEGSRIYRSEAIWFEPSTGSTSRLILGGVLSDGGIDAVIPSLLMKVLGGGTLIL